MTATVAVVGAGITGLACAEALGDAAAVTIVDRVPVAGGVHGWDRDETRDLVRRSGATLDLGVTATRWDGRVLLSIGPGRVRRLEADVLVVAAGARPLGSAELGIAGDRPGGVVSAMVAAHLAENRLPVGLAPCIVGGGDWAAHAAEGLAAAGAHRLTVVAPHGLRRDIRGADVYEGLRPVAVRGRDRVAAVVLEDGRELACDALVLAHGLTPVRNVDGAVDGGRRVVYAQPLADPASVEGARAAGRAAADEVLSMIDQGG